MKWKWNMFYLNCSHSGCIITLKWSISQTSKSKSAFICLNEDNQKTAILSSFDNYKNTKTYYDYYDYYPLRKQLPLSYHIKLKFFWGGFYGAISSIRCSVFLSLVFTCCQIHSFWNFDIGSLIQWPICLCSVSQSSLQSLFFKWIVCHCHFASHAVCHVSLLLPIPASSRLFSGSLPVSPFAIQPFAHYIRDSVWCHFLSHDNHQKYLNFACSSVFISLSDFFSTKWCLLFKVQSLLPVTEMLFYCIITALTECWIDWFWI